jgi:hypothetical protein
MNEGTYVIVKRYQVFRGESADGEPIDEPTEQLLFALLRARGRLAGFLCRVDRWTRLIPS